MTLPSLNLNQAGWGQIYPTEIKIVISLEPNVQMDHGGTLRAFFHQGFRKTALRGPFRGSFECP